MPTVLTPEDKVQTYDPAMESFAARRAPEDGYPIPLWIYSVNYRKGVRYIGQLLSTELEDSISRDHLLYREGHDASKLFAQVTTTFDQNDAPTNMDQLALQGALVYLGSFTKAWENLPLHGINRGLHYILFDWETVTNGLYIRPMLLTNDEILSGQVLIELLEQAASEQSRRSAENRPL